MLAAALSFVVVVALGVFSLPTDEVAEPGASPPSAVVTPTADVVASVASRTASREEVTELLEVIRRTADRDEVRRRLETVGELDPEQRRELAVTCVTTARQSADVAGQVMMRAFAGRPDGLKDLVRYVSLASLAAEVDPSFVLIESEYGEFMQGFWMLAVQKAPSQSAELMTALSLAVPDDPVLLALAAWSRSDASTGSVMVAQLERLRLGEPLQHEGEPSNCAWFRGEILQLLRGRVDRARFQQEVERELERPDASDAARELRGVIDRR